MTRRELIQKTSLALGYSISAPVLLSIMNSCKPQHALNYKPIFFTEDQAFVISALAEVLIPKTETPGAIDVGVPAFIETFVKEVYSKEDQDKFLKGIDEFNEGAKPAHGNLFSDCSVEEKNAYVKELHEQLAGQEAASDAWYKTGKMERPFLLKVKELTLLGFFTSEAGATQVLQYNMAPGPFQGCVPLEQVGKAWA